MQQSKLTLFTSLLLVSMLTRADIYNHSLNRENKKTELLKSFREIR